MKIQYYFVEAIWVCTQTRCNRHVARQARSLLAVSGNIDGLMETLLTKLVPRLVAFALKIILKEKQEVNNIR